STDKLQHAWQEVWGFRGEVRFWSFALEVYYLLFPEDCLDRIIDTVRFAGTLYPFIGVMTSLPAKQYVEAKQNRELSEGELRLMVERAEKVLFHAYDEESYLIWSKV